MAESLKKKESQALEDLEMVLRCDLGFFALKSVVSPGIIGVPHEGKYESFSNRAKHSGDNYFIQGFLI